MLPILLVPALVAAPAPKPQDTPPFDIASEYVRELCDLWEVQKKADQELAEDKASDDPATRSLMTTIRHSTRVTLALRTNISMLKKMRLTRDPHERTLGLIVGLYKQKLRLHNDVIDMATTFMSGPKPGVDYGKIAARMPQINAMLDDVDHTLYQVAILMFGALIDDKADSLNRCNHLLITKAQRENLVGQLNGYFGTALDSDKRYLVSSAFLMKTKLLEFKCSDEPWD